MKKITVEVAGQTVDFDVNSYARQSDGSVMIRCHDTVLLVCANASRTPKAGGDFLPLTMEYVERSQAAGKIPGGYFKREGRPSERAILTSRLMDRPIRPLFPEGYFCETQVIATIFSADEKVIPDCLAVTGASFALSASDIPLQKPLGCVRIGKVNGALKVNPTQEELKTSDLDLIVASTDEAIVMVEGGANELSESEMVDALMLGFESAQPYVQAQKNLIRELGLVKRSVPPLALTDALVEKVEGKIGAGIKAALEITEKIRRSRAIKDHVAKVTEEMKASNFLTEEEMEFVGEIVYRLESKYIRDNIVKNGTRIAKRGLREVRPITIETSVLPRTHGSALFTRGETRALVVSTLGTGDDEQRIDALEGEIFKRFMLHYNFPPFSTGEVKRMLSPGRREIGHGALAERSIARVLPAHDQFPYTIRVVSDILESNGSSSMASVCGASLALMDAGVPIKAAVAGIAMGLVQENGKNFILTDILGDEDHVGDMDFKVAGTRQGITGLQMDIKISGVTRAILTDALAQAREARLTILDNMDAALKAPRGEMSPHAPRITVIQINPEKIKDVIGPGGKVIRAIIAETGVKIDVDDTGKVAVASADGESMQKAIEWIQGLVAEAELGRIYKGKVRRIVDFGAFVEILPGTDGLLHVSQIDINRVENVYDFMKEGDEIEVKVIGIDDDNKIRLSRKAILTGSDGSDDMPPERHARSGGGDRKHGGSRRR